MKNIQNYFFFQFLANGAKVLDYSLFIGIHFNEGDELEEADEM
jgi:hypothetical protein